MRVQKGRFLSLVLAGLLAGTTMVACDDEEAATAEEAVEEVEEQEESTEETAEADFDPEDLPFYAEGPVAVIDGEEISAEDFNLMVHERISQLPGQLPPQMIEMFKGQIFDFAIDKHLIDRKLAGEEIEVTEEDIENAFEEFVERFGGMQALQQQLAQRGMSIDEIREDMEQDVQLEKYLSARYDLEVSEDDARAFFDEHRERFVEDEQVQARHVLLTVEEGEDDTAAGQKAQELYEQASGGADFEELARTHSQCPSSQQGGDLGFFPREQMVPAFSEAAFAMEPGEISEPVRTQFGYHIIQVVDKKEGGEVAFDEVQRDLELQLLHQKRQEVFQEFLESLKAEVEIERKEDNIVMNVEMPQQAQPQGLPGMPGGQGGGQGGQVPNLQIQQPN